MSHKIFHHNDADGRCAAFIMSMYFFNQHGYQSEFIEVNYGDDLLAAVERVHVGDVVAIVDFSFKPNLMAIILSKAERVIWCDHHVTAKDYDYGIKLPGYRDFGEKGLAGCECTWSWCFPDKPIPSFVSLLGDYDAWRLEQAPMCFEFYEGLKFHDSSPLGTLWSSLLTVSGFDSELIRKGKLAIRYREAYCAEMYRDFSYETVIDGHDAIALNLFRFGSNQFAEHFKEYPVCIAYAYDGRQFQVSLYSETVHVGEIAKKFGGGGHHGAAGFICEKLPF